MTSSLKVCFDRILPHELRLPPPASGVPSPRAAQVLAKRWPNGSTLRIRFLEGSPEQRDSVKQFATSWTKHGNLKLQFDDALDAEIRITFRDDGAWSYIGTDCLSIPRDQATMNYGWLDEGVVLHEFGHALGLIHEHQNPVGGIQWNRPQVYRDLSGSPNFWDTATIDHNMFAAYDRDLINGTALDKQSIMLYTIPARWTTNGFSSEPNEVLSETDTQFIGSINVYPFPPPNTGPVELPVTETTPTAATIGQPGEEDLYRFVAQSAGRYLIETEGPTDLIMALYGPDSQTQLITRDDDSGTDRNAKIIADLAPGTYFVQVRHFNRGRGSGSYTIKVIK